MMLALSPRCRRMNFPMLIEIGFLDRIQCLFDDAGMGAIRLNHPFVAGFGTADKIQNCRPINNSSSAKNWRNAPAATVYPRQSDCRRCQRTPGFWRHAVGCTGWHIAPEWPPFQNAPFCCRDRRRFSIRSGSGRCWPGQSGNNRCHAGLSSRRTPLAGHCAATGNRRVPASCCGVCKPPAIRRCGGSGRQTAARPSKSVEPTSSHLGNGLKPRKAVIPATLYPVLYLRGRKWGQKSPTNHARISYSKCSTGDPPVGFLEYVSEPKKLHNSGTVGFGGRGAIFLPLFQSRVVESNAKQLSELRHG